MGGGGRSYQGVDANSWQPPPEKKEAAGSSLAARRGKRGTSRDERRSVRDGVSDERWVADGR